MSLITRLISAIAVNLISLLAAAYFIPGFQISKDPKNLAIAVLIFTAINLFMRPILKLILGPLIIITLGLGMIFVNALTLYALDYFSKNVSIVDIPSLIYATLIIGAVNMIFHFIVKHD